MKKKRSCYNISTDNCDQTEFVNKKSHNYDENNLSDILVPMIRLLVILLPTEEYYTMVFDTETNALYGDIIQIAWIIVNSKNEIIKTVSLYIKNRKNKPDAFEVNHISDETLEEHGIEFYDAMKLFITDLNTCNNVIGHNVQYDTRTVNKNIKKFKIPVIDELDNSPEDIFIGKTIICTMKLYKSFIEPIEKEKNIKMSKKLIEMYKNFFGKEFTNAHDALGDIMATFECYKKLINV